MGAPVVFEASRRKVSFQDSDGNSDFPKPSTAKKMLNRSERGERAAAVAAAQKSAATPPVTPPPPPIPTPANNTVTTATPAAPRYVDVVRNTHNGNRDNSNSSSSSSGNNNPSPEPPSSGNSNSNRPRIISSSNRANSNSEVASRYPGGVGGSWRGTPGGNSSHPQQQTSHHRTHNANSSSQAPHHNHHHPPHSSKTYTHSARYSGKRTRRQNQHNPLGAPVHGRSYHRNATQSAATSRDHGTQSTANTNSTVTAR